MRLTSLNLFCFRKHKRLELNFAPATCILGPNGIGKSTVVEAIYFALTGELPEPHSLVVSYGNQTGEVQLTLNCRYNIQRAFGDKPKASMWLDNNLLANGAKNVNAYLESTFQITKGMLDCQIVRQGKLDEFITTRDSDRAAFFMRLVPNIHVLTNLWNQVGEFAATIRVDPAVSIDPQKVHSELESVIRQQQTIQQQLQEARRLHQIRELRAKKTTLEASISSLVGLLPSPECRKELIELQKAIKQHQQMKQELEKAAARVSELMSQRAGLRKEVEELWQRFRNRPQAVASAKNQMIGSAICVGIGSGAALILNPLIARLQTEPYICPLCKSQIDKQTAEQAAEAYSRLAQYIDSASTAAEEQLKVYESILMSNMDSLRQRAVIKAKARQLKEALRNVEEPDIGALCRYQQVENDLTALQQRFAALSQSVKDAAAKLDRIKELKEQLSQLEAAEKELIQLDRIVSLDVDVGELERQLVEATEKRSRLEQLLERYKSAKAAETAQKYLLAVRQVFHWDNLSKQICRRLLASLLPEINSNLKELDANFYLELPADSLCFTANLHSGEKVPDFALSGGQKVVAALAVRMALLQHYSKQFPVLILDEPTVYLDAERRQSLTGLMGHFVRKTSAKGFQLIVITHDQQLADVFGSDSGLTVDLALAR